MQILFIQQDLDKQIWLVAKGSTKVAAAKRFEKISNTVTEIKLTSDKSNY